MIRTVRSSLLSGRARSLAAAAAVAMLVLPSGSLEGSDAGEKAEIGGLKIKFTDTSALSASEMVKAVEEDVLAYLANGRRRSFLEDAAYRLEARIRLEGRPFARVGFEIADNGKRLRFDVDAGPEVEIESIVFEGARFLGRDELDDCFRAGSVIPLVEGRRLYAESRIEDAISDVKSRYKASGYIWAKVSQKSVAFSADRKRAAVVVEIEEGRRAVVSSLVFAGALLERPQDLEDLKALRGGPYSPGLVMKIRNRLLEFYAQQGYPFSRADVTPLIDSSTGAVSIEARVTEGRKTYVRRVTVEGNDITLDSVVLLIAGLRMGDLLTLDRRRKAIADLCLQGLFDEVDVRAFAVEGDAESADVLVKVKEADHVRIECSAGFHSYELLNGDVRIKSPNTFGTGRSVWLGAKLSFREWMLESGLHDPWVLNLPFRGQWRGFVGRRIENEFSAFRWGMDFSFTFPFVKELSATASYHYEYSDVYKADEGIDIDAFRELNISSIGIGVMLDLRDDPFNPKWGLLVDLLHEFGGRGLRGGVHFDRSILKAACYATPVLGVTFSIAGEASIVDPKSRTEDIPIQLRLFRGGMSSVRSFGERRLGPRNEAGSVIGGEGYLQFNAEMRVPLSVFGDVPLLKPFGVAVFYDTGSIKEHAAMWLDFTGFRHAVGAGIRLITPIGPVRLDVGWNPDRRHREDAYAVHIALGHAF